MSSNTTSRPPSGPYETVTQAREDSADVYVSARLQPESNTLSRINEGLMLGALTEAGVSLGAYDRHIITWLAGWEPEVNQVITGLIQRAHAAGKAGAR